MEKIFTLAFLVSVMLCSPVLAQKKHDHNRDDVVVTIKVNGKEQDIEAYFENWGEEFGHKIEDLFDGNTRINVDLDEDDLNISINNLRFDIEDFAESIAKTVEEAVTHMNIELSDVDPSTLDDVHFNAKDGDEVDDMIRDIERKYHSRVENVDKMKIQIRKDYMKIDMEVTLENGREVNKSRIFHNDD